VDVWLSTLSPEGQWLSIWPSVLRAVHQKEYAIYED
jgi:hypothetical protein